MKHQLCTLFTGLGLLVSGAAMADVNSAVSEDGAVVYVADSSVVFPSEDPFALPEGCTGTEIATDVIDITSCLDPVAVSGGDGGGECVVTVDLEEGTMEIPCVEVAAQEDELSAESAEPTLYSVFMEQRGNSMNWEVTFIEVSGQDEDGADQDEELDDSSDESGEDVVVEEIDGVEDEDDDKKGNNGKGNGNNNGKGKGNGKGKK